jgi:glucosyl-3-phosphoglycerate synthase
MANETESGSGPVDPGAVERWAMRRSFRAADFDLDDLVRRKRGSVAAILPARETADTIGPVLDALLPLRSAGLLDELVVVDADSRDGTADIADARGADVLAESELMPELGPVLGKGDAMWRALAATRSQIVAFIDTDTEDLGAEFALGLVGPLLTDSAIGFVKAAYKRPFRAGTQVVPDYGGRVNELVARPLLNLFFPELVGFAQPLAGEVAARRELLERLRFPVGYGVEIGMLIDVLREAGLEAMAQVDIGTRQNRHQPLRDLVPMAHAVAVTALRRADDRVELDELAVSRLAIASTDTFDVLAPRLEERPPLAAAPA